MLKGEAKPDQPRQQYAIEGEARTTDVESDDADEWECNAIYAWSWNPFIHFFFFFDEVVFYILYFVCALSENNHWSGVDMQWNGVELDNLLCFVIGHP